MAVETSTNAHGIETAQAELKDDFDLFDAWRDKIEFIIDLGKNLPDLPDALKQESNLVRGCQSQVWLITKCDPTTQKMHIQADSDAFIVRGLIAILLKIYNNQSPHDIVATPLTLFDEIGLKKHLTPGRSNGLYAMISQIKTRAQSHVQASSLS